GAELVIGHDDLGFQAAERAARLLDGQFETVADVDAQGGARPGQGGQQTDLDGVGGLGGPRRQAGGRHCGRHEAQGYVHDCSSDVIEYSCVWIETAPGRAAQRAASHSTTASSNGRTAAAPGSLTRLTRM